MRPMLCRTAGDRPGSLMASDRRRVSPSIPSIDASAEPMSMCCTLGIWMHARLGSCPVLDEMAKWVTPWHRIEPETRASESVFPSLVFLAIRSMIKHLILESSTSEPNDTPGVVKITVAAAHVSNAMSAADEARTQAESACRSDHSGRRRWELGRSAARFGRNMPRSGNEPYRVSNTRSGSETMASISLVTRRLVFKKRITRTRSAFDAVARCKSAVYSRSPLLGFRRTTNENTSAHNSSGNSNLDCLPMFREEPKVVPKVVPKSSTFFLL